MCEYLLSKKTVFSRFVVEATLFPEQTLFYLFCWTTVPASSHKPEETEEVDNDTFGFVCV